MVDMPYNQVVVGDCSQEQPEDSLFNSYHTEV